MKKAPEISLGLFYHVFFVSSTSNGGGQIADILDRSNGYRSHDE